MIDLWQSGSLHQGRQSRAVPRVRIGTKGQQELHALEVHRRDQVDLRAEEVPFVGISTRLQQRARHLDVVVPQGQPQRLVAQHCSAGPRINRLVVYIYIYYRYTARIMFIRLKV